MFSWVLFCCIKPVVVGVLGLVAALYLLQEVPELGLIHAELIEHASLFEEVEGQHRQRRAWSCISKSKDVELPIALCLLQARNSSKCTSL